MSNRIVCRSLCLAILFCLFLVNATFCNSWVPRYIGSAHAGWFIPHELMRPGSICYCFGAGEDISFEVALSEHYSSIVYCFDPAPWSINYVTNIQDNIDNPDLFLAYSKDQEVWDRFHFFPFGLWSTDTVLPLYAPATPKHLSHSLVNHQSSHCFEGEVKKLSTIMHDLGHDQLDLLKLDIEGAEYEVIKNILAEGIHPNIICVEFHRVGTFSKQEIVDLLSTHEYEPWFVHYNRDYTFIKRGLRSPTMGEQGSMHVHEYFTELFSRGKVSTEYYAYTLLKQSPLKGPIHYLALPWAQLINNRMLDQVPTLHLEGGFTICQHIDFLKIVPLLQEIGIDTLFTPHATQKTHIDGLTILPFPHFPVNGVDPADQKDIWYSFIGASTHKTRQQLFAMKHPANALVLKRKEWFFYASEVKQEQEKREYQDVLARSRFSLCPRGTGPSTIRFWESLQAGAIPVLISDDMLLPEDFDWETCIVRVPESSVDHIKTMLQAISPTKEAEMRAQCLVAYQQFSGEQFVSTIREYYEK